MPPQGQTESPSSYKRTKSKYKGAVPARTRRGKVRMVRSWARATTSIQRTSGTAYMIRVCCPGEGEDMRYWYRGGAVTLALAICVSVCVWERGSVYVYVCVCERERECVREWVCVCVCERESV